MVSQMYGWMDRWMDSVSSRYSFVVSQMDGRIESVSFRLFFW